MNLRITFTMLSLVLGTTLLAQINVSKLKNKVETAVSGDEKSDGGQVKKGGIDPATSPAAQTIRNYRNEISFASDAVKGQHYDAGDRLKKSKALLDKIKAEDPNWAEYDQDEALYLDLLKIYEKNNEGKIMQERVEKFNLAMHNIEREPWNGFGDVTVTAKKNYLELRAYYDNNPTVSRTYADNVFSKADNFYNVVLPQVRTESLKQQNEVLEKTTSYLSENRAKADYLENKVTGSFYVKDHIAQLQKGIQACDQGLAIYPNDAEYLSIKKTMETRIIDLEGYISSGQLAKDEEKRKIMDVDAIVLGTPAMKNTQLEEIVKRDLNTASYGTAKRVVILSSDWIIRRNEFGIILGKFLNVQVATDLNGTCYRVSGEIFCAYEGAGTYGKPNYYSESNTIMNCLNINKSAQ